MLAILGLGVALGIWVGRYRYDHVVLQDGESYPVRISRINGRSEVLYRGQWKASSVLPSLVKPVQSLGADDLRKLEANSVDWNAKDSEGIFELNLHNGSAYTLKRIEVEIAVKGSCGETSGY